MHGRRLLLGAALALAVVPTLTAKAQGLAFAPAVQLAKADGNTEPRVSIDPAGNIDVISNEGGTATVWRSTDGGTTYAQTPGTPAGQSQPTIDVDIVTLRTGRMVATELDFGGINFRTSYSDDGGKTWTASTFANGFPAAPATGTGYADTDRPWLAVGPPDASGNQPVYLLFHNLLSGVANHNMYVAKSADGGASWGTPVPITLPGQQAFNDLQCADSGGPSDIFVNQSTGRIYAVFGTRSTAPPADAAGGCGASATGAFEINVVAATRVWVATSPDGSLGSWTQSLAVDDNATGQIVGMQLAPGAVDSAGNVYVLYPESPKAYPDYDGAAIKLVHAPADLSKWSAPVTAAQGGGAGNVLPHIVAGDPGKLGLAWFQGELRPGASPAWYAEAAETTDALDPAPAFTYTRLSDIVTYTGTASQLMGVCGSGPAAGVENGFACGRSTDVWGIAVSPVTGEFTVAWPVSDSSFNDANPQAAGTYVATENGGDPLIATSPPVVLAESPLAPLLPAAMVVAAIITGSRLRRRGTVKAG